MLGAAALLGIPTAQPFLLALTSNASIISLSRDVSDETAQRRSRTEKHIRDTYLSDAHHRMSWRDVADSIDYIAQNTPSDDAFREDLWHFFGATPTYHGVFWSNLDPGNKGLPSRFHNSGYREEQVHHYLGGVTGKPIIVPTHLLNNPVSAYLFELTEIWGRGGYNWGDVRLFLTSAKHRDDFLRHGRGVVAANIREMLEPEPILQARKEGN